MESGRSESESAPARLGLWDAVSLILGIIIGAGIFKTPAQVFAQVPEPAFAFLVWGASGLLALVGACCFAELASTYPRSGGEYVYLTRAFGPAAGYLFAWAQLTLIRPGSIAAVAYIFAENAARAFGLDPAAHFPLTVGCLLLLTAINVIGVSVGAATQNIITIAKVVGLLILVGVGFLYAAPGVDRPSPPPTEPRWLDAFILVLWTYSGWHEAAYVAAEVKDRRKNLPRALLLGSGAVTVIYLLVNAALLVGLGPDAVRSTTATADILSLAWPERGASMMALLIAVSSLGAVNGMIFTTARIYAEFGADHRLFAALSRWSPRWQTPARALFVQGLVCLTLTLGVWLLGHGEDPFDGLLFLTSAVFWAFFLVTGIALFVLRRKDASLPRPFPVPGYPWTPCLFCAWCGAMMVGALHEHPAASWTGFAILAAGLLFYALPSGRIRPRASRPELPPLPRGEYSTR